MADLYLSILVTNRNNYPSKPGELSHRHLTWMCQEISDNHKEWPADKSNRWIGYVQGVLSALQITSVDVHRDMTREIIKESET